jgi:hypothetical protein
MSGNGSRKKWMDKVNCLAVTGWYCKGSSKREKLTVRLKYSFLMEICIRENGFRTKPMDLVSISIILGLCMRDIGIKTCKTESELKHGRITADMKGHTSMGRNMERVNTHGQTVATTKAPGKITKYKGTGSIFGAMEEATKDIGRRTRCMEKAFISGKMAEDMRETTCMIRRRDKENITGLMVRNFRVNG